VQRRGSGCRVGDGLDEKIVGDWGGGELKGGGGKTWEAALFGGDELQPKRRASGDLVPNCRFDGDRDDPASGGEQRGDGAFAGAGVADKSCEGCWGGVRGRLRMRTVPMLQLVDHGRNRISRSSLGDSKKQRLENRVQSVLVRVLRHTCHCR
jgi:hypothetical protein